MFRLVLAKSGNPESVRAISLRPGFTYVAAIVGTFIVASSGASFAGSQPPSGHAAMHIVPVSHTLYEHQDHRMLPIGTKIFYADARGIGVATYVRPGQRVPASLAKRVPNVIVVGPYDARATAVIERTKPAQTCCGRYNVPPR